MVTFSGDVPPLVSHSAHPTHALKLGATGGALFQCDGCKQIGGDERRYRCEQCDFDLHICCARAPAVFQHPMFEGSALTLFHSPPAMPPGYFVYCDVCGDQVLGFLYNCHEQDLYLHPFCANLPERIVEEEGRVLDLHRATGHGCRLCGQVGHRGQFLSYRLRGDDGEFDYFHVACMMEANYCSDDGRQDQVPISPTTSAVGRGRLQKAATTGGLASRQNAPPRVGEPARKQQSAPGRRMDSFGRFCQAAVLVARVTHAVSTLDPVGLVTAVASQDDEFPEE
jgi:hypothetical protein